MLALMGYLAACNDQNLKNTDTAPVDEDTGWEAPDPDDDTDQEDTDSGTPDDTDSGGDTDPQPIEPSECQNALMGTNPAYPVFPAWEGTHEVNNLTVTLTGATRTWATVSWGSGNSPEGWYISCGQIVGGSTAVIPVEPVSTYGASTFSNVDPGDGISTVDQNGFYWLSTPVTGGDLGGTAYTVTANDGWNAVLTAEE